MSRLMQRVVAAFFFAGAISLAGNSVGLTSSCHPLDLGHSSPTSPKDPEPAAVVCALQAVLVAQPTGRACDFWQDMASSFAGVSTANRARIQRFGEALHFANYVDAARRKAAVDAAIEAVRLANPDLPAEPWIAFLESAEKTLGPANP